MFLAFIVLQPVCSSFGVGSKKSLKQKDNGIVLSPSHCFLIFPRNSFFKTINSNAAFNLPKSLSSLFPSSLISDPKHCAAPLLCPLRSFICFEVVYIYGRHSRFTYPPSFAVI